MVVAASSHEMTITLSAQLASVPFARWFVAETLRRWSAAGTACEALLVKALLVASELMTDVLLHTEGNHTLRVRVVGSRIWVEVTDPSGGPIALETDGRRGALTLTERLSADWGIRRHDAGSVMWYLLEPDAPEHETSMLGDSVA